MSLASTFVLGLIVGVSVGFIIALSQTEFEPATNRLFFKKRNQKPRKP